MNFNIFAIVLLLSIGFVSCQWGYGSGYSGYYGGYGGYGGYGYGGYQQALVNNAANIGTQVAEGVLVAEEVQGGLGK